MSGFEIGDRVRVVVTYEHEQKYEGKEATVIDVFSDYGDDSVGVRFDDGYTMDRMESSVEYIGPDKYEYASQRLYKGSGEPKVEPLLWGSRKEAEDEIKLLGGSEFYKYILVKRRKAGEVERVEND